MVSHAEKPEPKQCDSLENKSMVTRASIQEERMLQVQAIHAAFLHSSPKTEIAPDKTF